MAVRADVLAGKYAAALIDYGRKKGCLPELEKNFSEAIKILWEEKYMRSFLLYPLTRQEKISFIKEISIHLHWQKGFTRFLNLLLTENRIFYLPDIYAKFVDLYILGQRKKRVKVESAVDLDVAMKEKIKRVLEEKYRQEIFLEFFTNQGIIAGLRLWLEDEGLVYDFSLENQLEKLKDEVEKWS